MCPPIDARYNRVDFCESTSAPCSRSIRANSTNPRYQQMRDVTKSTCGHPGQFISSAPCSTMKRLRKIPHTRPSMRGAMESASGRHGHPQSAPMLDERSRAKFHMVALRHEMQLHCSVSAGRGFSRLRHLTLHRVFLTLLAHCIRGVYNNPTIIYFASLLIKYKLLRTCLNLYKL